MDLYMSTSAVSIPFKALVFLHFKAATRVLHYLMGAPGQAKLIFRTINLQIDCVVREQLSLGLMKLLPLSSANQIADHFTKALAQQPVFHLIAKFILVNIYQSSICGML